jgi:hypothetical protein
MKFIDKVNGLIDNSNVEAESTDVYLILSLHNNEVRISANGSTIEIAKILTNVSIKEPRFKKILELWEEMAEDDL